MRVMPIVLGLMPLLACAAPKPPGKMLFDFTALDPALVEAQGAGYQLVDGFDGRGLELTVPAGQGYPGVLLRPAAGKWDVTGCIELKVDVENRGTAAVRVLVQAEEPGANGVEHCNTAGTTIDPGRRGTVTVTFGEWHGQARAIDLANLVAIRVFFENPTGGGRIVADNIRAVAFDRSAAEAVMAGDWFAQLENPLGRGVNMGNMLEAPDEGEWGVRLDERYFAIIREAGFENVRIPCRWNAHAAAEAPYTIDPAWMERVDRGVTAALESGLKVVLNIHHYEEMMRQPAEHQARLVALWRQIAEHFADAPPELLFELLNEPSGNLTSQPWNEAVAALLPVIRESNPERTIVVGPPDWNSADALPQLDLPEDDRNLIVTFHYYNPFAFTHQGAGWVGPNADQWLGTEWRGSEAEQRAVIKQFDAALVWAAERRRPLYVGEFGAYSRADLASRERWTRYIADQALERKFGYAYWEFASGFGCYDPDAGAWREGLLGALTGR